MKDITIERLIEKHRTEGFTTLHLEMLERLGINMHCLESLFNHVDVYTASSPKSYSSTVRLITVGEISAGDFEFMSFEESPICNVIERRYYCEAMAQENSLAVLLRILLAFEPLPLYYIGRARFCIELIRRTRESERLPYHYDGVYSLLFLVLNNTMKGGALQIAKLRKPSTQPNWSSDSGGVFYSEEDIEFLNEIPCERGNGYIISEKAIADIADGPSIVHGCKAWEKFSFKDGERVNLRISIQLKN